jgi:uncharacterized membrane protein YkoI
LIRSICGLFFFSARRREELRKERTMNAKWILAVVAAAGLFACAGNKRAGDELEPGETKVKLDQTPAAVQATLKKELAGAELEDISKKQEGGRTVYETDLIRDGQKWEVVVGEDGAIISKAKEGSPEERARDKGADEWQKEFEVSKADLSATGKNRYLTIQPGRALKLKSGSDTLTITILPETPTIDGVKVGVLEERETKGGKLIEVSRNFFATDAKTGDVYYFGEDVDNYKDGKIVDHESAWRAGVDGARFGMMVPGKPVVGQKYYQEIAPKVAMDRVEVVSVDETLKTPAGTFSHCLHLKETTPLERGESHKWYAPGVGMVKDDEFELGEKP